MSSKYRIKEEVNKNGDIKYYPQYLSFYFLWVHFSGVNFLSQRIHKVECDTYEEALELVEKWKDEYEKPKKDGYKKPKKVKYHEV